MLQLDHLPAPETLTEQDYQQLLKILYDEKGRVTQQADQTISDMMDYYTLWVHQIKTPIAAMRLLVDAKGGDEALLAELFKIEQYVEMVLTYMRLESESTDYVLKQCALDDIIRQAVRKYAKLFILKRVALDYHGTDLTVMSDEKWLGFVIEQILSNAIKYTNAGAVSIYTSEEKLIIQDTGIGICQADLPRIFQKGFTGYNGREDKQSTGLGLYLSKRILRKLSHTILIESGEQGTKVIIGFPKKFMVE